MTVVECANDGCGALIVETSGTAVCTSCRRKAGPKCGFCGRGIAFGSDDYCSKNCRTAAEHLARRRAERASA